jgi:NAD(P)-dependent dehydrogenase (short-subunit alcohol dehydrogenase family)
MVVLVTGCGSGFGRLTALELARQGHRVYAGVRNPAGASALAEEGAAVARGGGSLTVVPLDVTDAAQREAAVARILDEAGCIDALVNNAGVALGGFLESVDEDEFRAVLDTNVLGAWAMTCAVLPAMRVRRKGRILMVSSMSGRIGLPGVGVYAASKWALEGMSESWRHELALFGIQVVLVEPAQFKTDIFERNRRVSRRAVAPGAPWTPYAEHLDRVVSGMVSRSAGDPQRVADLIATLLTHPRPRLRYPIGPNARLRELLGRYVPFAVTERWMARWLRL